MSWHHVWVLRTFTWLIRLPYSKRNSISRLVSHRGLSSVIRTPWWLLIVYRGQSPACGSSKIFPVGSLVSGSFLFSVWKRAKLLNKDPWPAAKQWREVRAWGCKLAEGPRAPGNGTSWANISPELQEIRLRTLFQARGDQLNNKAKSIWFWTKWFGSPTPARHLWSSLAVSLERPKGGDGERRRPWYMPAAGRLASKDSQSNMAAASTALQHGTIHTVSDHTSEKLHKGLWVIWYAFETCRLLICRSEPTPPCTSTVHAHGMQWAPSPGLDEHGNMRVIAQHPHFAICDPSSTVRSYPQHSTTTKQV